MATGMRYAGIEALSPERFREANMRAFKRGMELIH
jgi:hypothetical protein